MRYIIHRAIKNFRYKNLGENVLFFQHHRVTRIFVRPVRARVTNSQTTKRRVKMPQLKSNGCSYTYRCSRVKSYRLKILHYQLLLFILFYHT